MGLVLRVVIFAALGFLIFRAIRGAFGGAGSGSGSGRFPCSTCRHCKQEFDDGVICMFADRETFKNEVHIANCGSWQRRGAG